jgi:DNA replication protein DnaC
MLAVRPPDPHKSRAGRVSSFFLHGVKTLKKFDFDLQPNLNRRRVRDLAGMSFLERSHNVVIMGPPGVGKIHMAVALGVKAMEAGYSVMFHNPRDADDAPGKCPP